MEAPGAVFVLPEEVWKCGSSFGVLVTLCSHILELYMV